MSQILNLYQFGNLGTAIPGQQPPLIGGSASSQSGSGMVGSSERGLNRKILRQSFGNNALGGIFEYSPLYYAYAARKPNGQAKSGGQGPFRAAMNAGDLMGTVNEGPHPSLPKPNQVTSVSNMGFMSLAGSVKTGNAAYTGNPKYVYDSSDYVRYKKLKAINSNYNDISFGGSNNGSYTSLKAVRH